MTSVWFNVSKMMDDKFACNLCGFCFDKIRTERCRCCDVTDQHASHGGCEAAHSYHARLYRQFPAAYFRLERALDKLLDCVSLVHQQRRQLLHLPGSEHGIQEGNESYDQRHIEESATWHRARNIRAVSVPFIADCLT